MNAELQIRLAGEEDIPRLHELILHSARTLLVEHYSAEQVEAALGPVFGVDRQLIADCTYFIAEWNGVLAGCGGWSRRRSQFGSDQARSSADPLLDPEVDPARIRAFFIHPEFTRRGIGRALLLACEEAIRVAGFQQIALTATAAGEPLYAANGYAFTDRIEIPLRDGLTIGATTMAKRLPIRSIEASEKSDAARRTTEYGSPTRVMIVAKQERGGASATV